MFSTMSQMLFHPSSPDRPSSSSLSRSSKPSILPSASQIGFSGAWLTPHPSALPTTWTAPKPHGPGLTNLGNTCFLNSIVQALVAIASVTAMLFEHPISHSCTHTCPACAMHILTSGLHPAALNQPLTRVNPRPLTAQLRAICPVFAHGRQQDAHEFLRGLLDALAKCQLLGCAAMRSRVYVSMRQERTSSVHKLFGGMLQSVVRCTQCGYASTQLEPFLDLSLETAPTIAAALTRFCHVEVLDGDNRYRCGGCDHMVRATKRLSVRRAPNVLCLQLKRFDGRNRKNSRFIRYPESLDLGPAMPGLPRHFKAMYELRSLVVHVGESRAHGHYRAFVKGSNGTWCMKDDAVSRVVGQATALKQEAYILFYSRVPCAEEVRGKKASDSPLSSRQRDDEEVEPRSPPSTKSPPPDSSESDSMRSPKSPPSSSSSQPEQRRSDEEEAQTAPGGVSAGLQMLIVGSAYMQEVMQRRFTARLMRRTRSEACGGAGEQKAETGNGEGSPKEERRSEPCLERPRWLGGGRSSPPREGWGGFLGGRRRATSPSDKPRDERQEERNARPTPQRRGLFWNVGQWGGWQESKWEAAHEGKGALKRRRANDEQDEEYDRGKTRKVRQKSRKDSSGGFSNPFDRKR